MQTIYSLEHVRPISADQIIGFFSSKDKVEAALNHYKTLPGFCDFPDNLYINEYNDIDEIYDGYGFIMENDLPYWAKDEQPIGRVPKKKGRNVYVLAYGLENDISVLGVYSSRKKAEKAIGRFMNKDYFDGFEAEKFSIGQFILNVDQIDMSSDSE